MKAGQTLADGNNRNICWLASFPKSGNTWTRILLSNLTGHNQQNDDRFNISLPGSISSNRVQFDSLTGLPSSDLTDDEIDLLRPDNYREVSSQSSAILYTKVHDGYHLNTSGEALFPADCSYGAIYLVRNPLDVAISYAHHQGHRNFAKIVDQINDLDHVMAGGSKSQLRQKTLGWAGHYRSWHDQTAIPVLTIRYEDMIDDTAACLLKMAQFLQLEEAGLPDRIAAAVEASRFEKMQQREAEQGFKERPEKAERFFRSGRIGEGSELLSDELKNRIYEANRDLMQELGYIAPD